jgi:hypothetical protein
MRRGGRIKVARRRSRSRWRMMVLFVEGRMVRKSTPNRRLLYLSGEAHLKESTQERLRPTPGLDQRDRPVHIAHTACSKSSRVTLNSHHSVHSFWR